MTQREHGYLKLQWIFNNTKQKSSKKFLSDAWKPKSDVPE